MNKNGIKSVCGAVFNLLKQISQPAQGVLAEDAVKDYEQLS
jgi:hypothetical protein